MLHKRCPYTSDLSDKQWRRLKRLLPTPRGGRGRPMKLCLREVVNAILSLIHTGCRWSKLPYGLPNFNSVYYHFRKWCRDGTWQQVNLMVRKHQRRRQKRKAEPSAAIVDRQNVKTTETRLVQIVAYDLAWPHLFEREADRIRAALGAGVLMLEHVGSTSVPGLAAKPKIDMLLVVADSADEAAYLPQLEAAGYRLQIREPDWYEHRLFKGPDTDINLHVLPAGCPEIERMLVFRDWLRGNPADRALYEHTKRTLAEREWKTMQHYADAKTPVVQEILARAQAEAGNQKVIRSHRPS